MTPSHSMHHVVYLWDNGNVVKRQALPGAGKKRRGGLLHPAKAQVFEMFLDIRRGGPGNLVAYIKEDG